MTGQELKDFTTELLGGREMGDTFFYQQANLAKDNREGMRPWMKLRKESSGTSFAASDSYLNMKTLPTDFLVTYGNSPLKLVSGATVEEFTEIPLEQRRVKQSVSGLFYIDHGNEQFAITGNISQAMTGYLYYVKRSADIDASTGWIFPEAYHPILAADICIAQKGSVDYDELNERMVKYHGLSISDIWNAMVKWDDRLQRAALNV